MTALAGLDMGYIYCKQRKGLGIQAFFNSYGLVGVFDSC